MNNQDRRVRKTRKRIEESFLELLHEKEYEAITVQDILQRADVGRATFYAHYRDKEEVAVTRFLDMLEELGLPAPSENSPRLLPVKEMFLHAQEMAGLKTFGFKGNGLSMYLEYGRRFWSKKLVAQVEFYKKRKMTGDMPETLFILSALNLLMNFFTWWLRENPQPSPEKMDKWYHRMVFGKTVNP